MNKMPHSHAAKMQAHLTTSVLDRQCIL